MGMKEEVGRNESKEGGRESRITMERRHRRERSRPHCFSQLYYADKVPGLLSQLLHEVSQPYLV